MARVKIYTRKWCGYCTSALQLLDQESLAYDHVDATNDGDTRTWLVRVTGRDTVPQIFIDGRSLGGYTELRALQRSGELARLMAVVPAVDSPNPVAPGERPAKA